MKSFYSFILILFFSGSLFGQVLAPKEIIKKSEEKLRGWEQAVTEIKIEVIRPKWSRRMKLKSWAKGND